MDLPMTQADYVARDGRCCPFCGSESIEGGSVEITDSGAEQDVTCLECDREWQDYYKLEGYLTYAK